MRAITAITAEWGLGAVCGFGKKIQSPKRSPTSKIPRLILETLASVCEKLVDVCLKVLGAVSIQ